MVALALCLFHADLECEEQVSESLSHDVLVINRCQDPCSIILVRLFLYDQG